MNWWWPMMAGEFDVDIVDLLTRNTEFARDFHDNQLQVEPLRKFAVVANVAS